MATDPWGFLRYPRQDALVRPVDERVKDWHAVTEPPSGAAIQQNATRCMDCGMAFCEHACPIGNQIPRFHELLSRGRWRRAAALLHASNNFPEFTGSLCPAPCEAGCVLSIGHDAAAIRQAELAVIDRAFDEGWVAPLQPSRRTGRRVAVVGSGPAGLAAAQQLTRAGHDVSVFERADRIGGLLRYGIPDFRMDKAVVDRRLDQLSAEGTHFHTNVDIGRDLGADELRSLFDIVIIACGATRAREIHVPGSEIRGVHQGMDYLVDANRVQAGDRSKSTVDAAGRRVAIIGGGDTASDCLATANRQGAASVHVLDHNPVPPEERDTATNPWPQWPRVRKHGFAQEEGVQEEWQAEVYSFVPDAAGRVAGLRSRRVNAAWLDGVRRFEALDACEFELDTDLVLLAMGFDGVERSPLLDDLAVELTTSGTIAVDENWSTSTTGTFACGDAVRGASLVAWAIAEGRACAASAHEALTGDNRLPRPVKPGDRPL